MILRTRVRFLGKSYACYARTQYWQSCYATRKSCSARDAICLVQRRSITVRQTAKRQRAVPQGLLVADVPNEDDDVVRATVTYPTVIEQARQNMLKYSSCVLLTKVGSFYEMYFDQAEELGPLLGLKVASKRTSAGPVSMAGFPFVQLERYLKILVEEQGKHVAISEEQRNDVSQKVKSGGLEFNREVKRIVTAGTLIDEQFLRPLEHNYLLAIHFNCDEMTKTQNFLSENDESEATMNTIANIGLAWIDISSGDFFVQSTDIGALPSVISRIAAREVVLDEESRSNDPFGVASLVQQDGRVVSFHSSSNGAMDTSNWSMVFDDNSVRIDSDAFRPEETSAAIMLLNYTQSQLPGLQLRLQGPIRQSTDEHMAIDRNSLRGLEITQTLRDGSYKGSLLHSIRRTSTESGARLLTERLTAPSMSLTIINERLDLVQVFLDAPRLLEDLKPLLKKTSDTLRIVQRLSFGRGQPDDLLDLSRTIMLTQSVAEQIQKSFHTLPKCIESLLEKFQWLGPSALSIRIAEAIDEEGLMARQRSEEADAAETAQFAREVIGNESQSEDMAPISKRLNSKRFEQKTSNNGDEEKPALDEIWVMRRAASSTLTHLHQTLEDLKAEKSELSLLLRQQFGASSLNLKFTPGLGHICHIKGKDLKVDFSSLNARVVSSSKSTRSFYLPQWTKLGTRIEEAKVRIRNEENAIFASLREEVIRNLIPLRRNAGLLDEIDVACSSACLAEEHRLTRPNLTSAISHEIIQGRHLTVEHSLLETDGRTFTPNDCILNASGEGIQQRIQLVTGPNMAGKSTFLRQSALISILAQMGSYVPAAYASVGLVDKIFSRVGSADNLAQDQSTFMVEMLETAQILRNATPRSFVIMDEVGRGTTPEDGIAVGFAVLKHLWDVNKCRALFATHFHRLAEMTKDFDGISCFCTDVIEENDGTFRYDHRMRPGVNHQSHALKVARLAGMPASAVKTARNVLMELDLNMENGGLKQEARKA